MNMKRLFLTAVVLGLVFQVKAQQIGTGLATAIDDFNVPLLTGMYYTNKLQEGYPTDAGTYRYLMVIRHPSLNNNCQLQMATSYTENNRLFFRKIWSTTLVDRSTAWHEIATRGNNTFTGVQTFNGSIKGNAEGEMLQIQTTHGYVNVGPRNTTGAHVYTDRPRFYFNKPIWLNDGRLSAYSTYNLSLETNGYNRMTILASNGNVGIGTNDPTAKLTVAGEIKARKVTIEVNAGADFVFADDYNLLSLEEVERFISTNKHLPDIAPAGEMVENGVSVSEFQIQLLQKIEELTLYLIDQDKVIRELQQEIQQLKHESK
jgi:hypothetical protein